MAISIFRYIGSVRLAQSIESHSFVDVSGKPSDRSRSSGRSRSKTNPPVGGNETPPTVIPAFSHARIDRVMSAARTTYRLCRARAGVDFPGSLLPSAARAALGSSVSREGGAAAFCDLVFGERGMRLSGKISGTHSRNRSTRKDFREIAQHCNMVKQ